MVDLSIVIVNYNVKYFVEQCLRSITLAKGGIKIEVFLVDNNSSDNSIHYLKPKFPEVQFIENTENLGFSKANNQAIRLARGTYVLLLNPDTIVSENAFAKIISYLDKNQDVGALGVKMVDGRGKFLPESKRALPTPKVAFYKMSGLSRLFPKSKTFGQYHLSYLNEDQTHKVEVLSGAFMVLRKKVLDEIGLLDEDFFMYGEDIDLSYRVIKGGYKNVYFPTVKIVHYKGESTKKSSINYVVVFYKAMAIFAEKHFSESQSKWFGLMIGLSIWFKASLSILQRLIGNIYQPLIDFIVVLLSLFQAKDIYQQYSGKIYSADLTTSSFLFYTAFWIGSFYLSGFYRSKTIGLLQIFKAMVLGLIGILIVYALLPEELRFSRAILLLGSALILINILLVKYALKLGKLKNLVAFKTENRKMVLVGFPEEIEGLEKKIRPFETNKTFFRVHPLSRKDDQNGYYIGTLDKLDQICKVLRINEVIFCGKHIEQTQIINAMTLLRNQEISIKIASPENSLIIGSDSIHNAGHVQILDLIRVWDEKLKKGKRFFDLLTASILALSYPFIKGKLNPKISYTSVWKVLKGQYTFVGVAKENAYFAIYPKYAIIKLEDEFSGDTELQPYFNSYQYKIDLAMILSTSSRNG